MKDDRSYNRVSHGPRRQDPHPPTVRKVPADSVAYGPDISLNGKTVWAAFAGDRLVAYAATAQEARRKYREVLRRELSKNDAGVGA